MNLLTEYQKRHKEFFIPVCHDGVCFFNNNDIPAMISLTSLACRSFSTCNLCNEKSATAIVELFVPGFNTGSFLQYGHYHVNLCHDLLSVINDANLTNLTPFYAKDIRDLEIWLWKFCLKDSKMRGLKSTETDPSLKTLEQITYACQKHPKLYNAYHIAYEAFLPSRKYMLFE